MLGWSVIFLVIAMIAAALGFGGIASDAADITQVLFFLFLAIFVWTLALGLAARKELMGS